MFFKLGDGEWEDAVQDAALAFLKSDAEIRHDIGFAVTVMKRRLGVMLRPWNAVPHIQAVPIEISDEVQALADGEADFERTIIYRQLLDKATEGLRNPRYRAAIKAAYPDDGEFVTAHGRRKQRGKRRLRSDVNLAHRVRKNMREQLIALGYREGDQSRGAVSVRPSRTV